MVVSADRVPDVTCVSNVMSLFVVCRLTKVQELVLVLTEFATYDLCISQYTVVQVDEMVLSLQKHTFTGSFRSGLRH